MSSAVDCEIGAVRWWFGPGISPDRARAAIEEALGQLAAGANDLRRGRRKQLYRLALTGCEMECLLKVHRYDRGADPFQRLGVSKSRRELEVAAALDARGIETPVPIAAGEARAGGRLRCCYLLTPVLDDVQDLKELWSSGRISPSERRCWTAALGHLARRLHDAGLWQEDFAPNNFLLRRGEPPRILPIDFERARMRRSLGVRPRLRMLAKLDRHLASASAADRMRFLLAYLDGDRSGARRWLRSLVRVAARLAARDRARLRRTGTADGRRFRTVVWGGWSGWALRDAPELVQAESRTAGSGAVRPPDTLGILVEPDASLWRGSGGASRAEARNLWATAHMLWARGELVPRPVACLTRGDQLRFWLARDATSQTLLQCCDSPEARRAAIVLVDRLLALGGLDPWLSTRKIAVTRRRDGGLRAQLLDPSAFRAARPALRRRRERARAFVGQRLREVQQLREIIRDSGR